MRRHLFLTVTLVLFLSLAVNAFAATYYVKPHGNDNLDGRSDATAWKTIGKVNSYSFATGDDVYFKCGGTWTGTQLRVYWSGNSGDRAVIGAYYMNGTEVIGVSGNKPIIDGNDIVPSSSYRGLIHASDQDYIAIGNIKVINSACYGLNIENGSNINVANIETDRIYNAGIRYKTVDSGVIEGCDVYNAGRTELDGGDWPAVLALIRSCRVTIRKNTVHENYGEGIGVFMKSHDNIVEDNVCYANKKVQLYIGRSRRNIVRRNLCYGTSDKTFWRGSFPGHGITVADESWGDPASSDNVVHNNFVAYCSSGIRFSPHPDSAIINTHIYNNTLVDCQTNILNFSGPYLDSSVKNNISWCTSGASTHASIPPNHSGLFIDYNLWSSTPDPDAQGAHDPSYAPPQLSKTSGWRSIKGGDLKITDFALQNNSPAVDCGTSLGSEFSKLSDCDDSVWPDEIVLKDQHKQGSGWEIGADIHVTDSTGLYSPTGLGIAAIL